MTPKNTPNARTCFVVGELLEAIEDPLYEVPIPNLKAKTWECALSPVDVIRRYLRVTGRATFTYGLMLAFREVVGGIDAGSIPGKYETIEECLLRKEVLAAIFRKPHHPNMKQPIATKDTAALGPFLVFVGAMWEDAKGLSQVIPWICSVFVPLIRVALRAYDEFGEGIKKDVKVSKTSQDGDNTAGELIVLQRIHAFQILPPARTEADVEMSFLLSPLRVAYDSVDGESDQESVSALSSTGTIQPLVFFLAAEAHDSSTLEPAFTLNSEASNSEHYTEDQFAFEDHLLPDHNLHSPFAITDRSPLFPRTIEPGSSPLFASAAQSPSFSLDLFAGASPVGWQLPSSSSPANLSSRNQAPSP
ncbi:hypothetical protein B0H16DRAFT_1721333 [Mycena metata]|uniref:Uncharacterized protein n=1 Tax=Mycena metata TaxID=1033252 RepID=A0AAD7NF17_9AGAR|nr:hypothetical protein B0H16DRAFT_1721333 [Mycena metata]